MFSLKRGQGMTTNETSWNSNSAEWVRGPSNTPNEKPEDWTFFPVFVPNGKEEHVGFKSFDGVEYAVFKCLDDSYLAQPKNICEAPQPTDPMKVSCFISPDTKADLSYMEVLTFEGTNWKLAGANKWVLNEVEFDPGSAKILGGRDINGTLYKVVQQGNKFVAFT